MNFENIKKRILSAAPKEQVETALQWIELFCYKEFLIGDILELKKNQEKALFHAAKLYCILDPEHAWEKVACGLFRCGTRQAFKAYTELLEHSEKEGHWFMEPKTLYMLVVGGTFKNVTTDAKMRTVRNLFLRFCTRESPFDDLYHHLWKALPEKDKALLKEKVQKSEDQVKAIFQKRTKEK